MDRLVKIARLDSFFLLLATFKDHGDRRGNMHTHTHAHTCSMNTKGAAERAEQRNGDPLKTSDRTCSSGTS